MNAKEHAAEAGRLLAAGEMRTNMETGDSWWTGTPSPQNVARAQVHATLAFVEAMENWAFPVTGFGGRHPHDCTLHTCWRDEHPEGCPAPSCQEESGE